jgi:hypothetical protein
MTSEDELEVALARFMKARGWRRYRNQIGVYQIEWRTQRIGTPGYPDWTFRRSTSKHGTIEICHVETKASGKKPSSVQLEQIALLNHLGEPAIWIDNMEKFELWYLNLFSR